MQKKLFSWMTIALMAFVCVGFAACGSDDEGGGGSGGGSTKFNGQSYNLIYGYWDAEAKHGYTVFEFSSIDITKTPSSNPGRIDMLVFSISGITSPDPGTYDATIELYSFTPTTSEASFAPTGGGRVRVTIAKSGDKHTITIPATNITYYSTDDEESGTSAPFSFSWTGTLRNYDFSK